MAMKSRKTPCFTKRKPTMTASKLETEEVKPRTVKLASAMDVRRLLAKVVNQHRQGDMPDNKAKVQGYLLSTLLKAISDTVTEERMAEIEEQIRQINEREF
jgi:hypothetical protein